MFNCQDGIDSTNNAISYYTAAADNKNISAITSTTSATNSIQNLVAAASVTASPSTTRLNIILGYTSVVPTTIAWTPTTGLYTNAAATTPYTGGNATVVYAVTNDTTTYTATASN